MGRERGRRRGWCLNVVRPGRPEQSGKTIRERYRWEKSQCSPVWKTGTIWMVGGFRSDAGAGSQCSPAWKTGTILRGGSRPRSTPGSLNVVRPGRPKQSGCKSCWRPGKPTKSQCSPAWKTGTMVLPSKPQPEFPHGLNVVRSGRPEQFPTPLPVTCVE